MSFLDDLTSILQADMPKETLFVAPTMAQGRRLLKQCARKGQLLVGVRVVTPMTLAGEIMASELARSGAPLLMEEGQAFDMFFECLAKMPDKGYFAKDHVKDRKAAELFYDIISKLDRPECLNTADNERLSAVEQLFNAYTKAKGNKYIDGHDLLKLAVKEEFCSLYDESKFVTLANYQFSFLEKELLKHVSNDKIIIVEPEFPKNITVPEQCVKDSALKAAPATAKIDFCRCRGEEVEYKYIFRDILARKGNFEDCAIVYLSSEYTAGLASAAELYNIPLAVMGGVPMTGSSLYYVLNGLLGWPATEYDAEALRNILMSGAVHFAERRAFCNRLRDKGIGWGKERYFNEFFVTSGEKYPPDEKLLHDWRKFTETIFAACDESGTIEEQKTALSTFLSSYCAPLDKEDVSAYGTAQSIVKAMYWLDEGESCLSRLVSELQERNYNSSSEIPGAVFALPLRQAFMTGRKHLYICGMSRFCLQNGRNESPVLLDAEKTAYNAVIGHKDFLTVADREKANTFRLYMLLLHHEGTMRISYPDYDTEKMIELQPAPVYRTLKGEHGKESQISMVPEANILPQDYFAHEKPVEIQAGKLSEVNDSIEPANLNDKMSYKDQFKAKTFSPTSLETAISCPLKYYLNRILGLEPYNPPKRSNDVWLDAAEMGSLCHKVLERYYKEKNADVQVLLAEEFELLKKSRPITRKEAMENDIAAAEEMILKAIAWTTENKTEVIATEKAFGYTNDTDLVTVKAGSKEIQLSGSIDRVDKLADGSYAILDYKTGRAENYRDNLKEKLQPYLYTLVAEQLYKGTQIHEAGYLFLKNRAEYLSVPETEAERQAKANMLEQLLTSMEDEKFMQQYAPAFVIDDNGNIKGTGTDEEQEAAYASCGRYCEYADFCKKIREDKLKAQTDAEQSKSKEGEQE